VAVSRHRSNQKRNGKSYAGFLIGILAMIVAIAVGQYSNHPELIRLIGYTLGIFAAIVYVFWSSLGRRVWFWLTLLVLTISEFAALLRTAGEFDRVSAQLSIPVGIAAGVFNIAIIFIVGAICEPTWRKKRNPLA
jgi:hypothetical protein